MEATILERLMGLRRVLVVVVAAVALLAVMSLALAPGSARAGGIPNYTGYVEVPRATPTTGVPVDGGETPAEPVYALPPCYVEFGSNVCQ